MFRHNNVASDDKVVLDANFFQNLQEQILTAHGTQKLLSSITGTRDEMPIAATMDPSQAFGHGFDILTQENHFVASDR